MDDKYGHLVARKVYWHVYFHTINFQSQNLAARNRPGIALYETLGMGVGTRHFEAFLRGS